MKLRVKLLLPLIDLPLLLMGWLINERLTTSLRQSHFDQAETLLDQVSLMVNAELATAEANLELYSRSALLKQYLLADEEDRFGPWQRPLLELFSGYVKSYPNYYEIRVLRPDGFEETYYSSHPAANLSEQEGEPPVFQELQAAEHHYLAPYLDPNTGIQSFLIAKPVALLNPAVGGDLRPSLPQDLVDQLREALPEMRLKTYRGEPHYLQLRRLRPGLTLLPVRELVAATRSINLLVATVTLNARNIGSMMEVEVVDTGRDMKPELLAKLFRVGEHSISSPGTNNEKGTGLGLILCKEFADAMGLTQVSAFNGLEALQNAKTQHFDLILMDIDMPKMNGIEATLA